MICCENPSYIVNPSIVSFVQRATSLYLDGVIRSIDSIQRRRIIDGNSFYKVFHLPYLDFNKMEYQEVNHYLNNYFFLDSESGETFPVFVEVPCNHCALCKARKVSSYMQRAQFAAEESMQRPLFITLTYNDEHCPKDGVNKRDVQLFKKRFRSSLISWFNNHDRLQDLDISCLKFLVSSEYTPETRRPHYHMFVFGMPRFHLNDTSNFYEVCHFVQYLWRDAELLDGKIKYRSYKSFCEKYPKIFCVPKGYDPFSKGYANVCISNSVNAVSYILKYSLKSDDSNVPEGKNKNFVLSSKNLGVQWLMKFRPEILSSKCNSFIWQSAIDFTIRESKICSYYIKKLFPSFSTLVPSELRKAVNSLHTSVVDLTHSYTVENSVKYAALSSWLYVMDRHPLLYSDLPIASDSEIRNNARYLDDSAISAHIDNIIRCVSIINNHDINYAEIAELCKEREIVLSKIATFDTICHRSRKARENARAMCDKAKLL